ncbi:hypothetical protein GCM10018772_42480 [Streptomyces fumanus]|uniref:Uncharacterized protein n=1 Tax=Streptomyces fumanus TaxID=67302 RepID=A0A919AMD5_9ACTN|nr:hypothetical protein GCM10018772_42480 [Streptomyces fumanus]
MQGVLTGFAVIAVVIGVGFLLGRGGHLGEHGREVLTRLAFHVAFAVAATGLRVPAPVLDPLTLIGNMSVPAVLPAFGISLCGSSMPPRGADRGPVLLAVALKAVGQPAVARDAVLVSTVVAVLG